LPGVSVQIADAQDDISRQLSQVQNFIANGVDAIIVNPVDTSATVAITKAAARRRRPARLRQPAADRRRQTRAEGGFRRLERSRVGHVGDQGKYASFSAVRGASSSIEGQLRNQAAVQRTKDIHEVISTPECTGIKIIAEQTAEWDRTKGQNLMTNWLSKGMKFDAVGPTMTKWRSAPSRR